jgi:hypothetical protein
VVSLEVPGWQGSSTGALLRALAPAAASLALNVGTSVLVFPYFTYVESSGALGPLLPQVWRPARAAPLARCCSLPPADIRASPKPRWAASFAALLPPLVQTALLPFCREARMRVLGAMRCTCAWRSRGPPAIDVRSRSQRRSSCARAAAPTGCPRVPRPRQALFGVRVVADIAGRLLPTAALLVGRRRLPAASGVKSATALLFLAHVALGRTAPRRAPGTAGLRAGLPEPMLVPGWTARWARRPAASARGPGCKGRARPALMRTYTHGTPQRHAARGLACRWRSDAAALLFVGAFWAASGLLSAAAYVAAQAWAPPGCGGRAGGLMALVFQARAGPGLRLAPAGHHWAG